MHHFGAIFAFLAAVLTVPSASDAGVTSRCAVAKMEASGRLIRKTAQCHAKATRKAVPPAEQCLGRAAARLTAGFSTAERKGDCLTLNDVAIVTPSVNACVAGVVAALPHDGTTLSRRCTATRLVASANRASMTLRCWRRPVRNGVGLKTTCLEKAALKFDRAFAKATKRRGCVGSSDSSTLSTAVDGFATSLAMALAPQVLLTTTTTFVGQTTTSTSTTVSTSTTFPGQTTTTTVSGSTTSTSTTLPIGRVDFSTDIQPILTANCAVPGCHAGVIPAQGLDLREGQAHSDLVGVASAECPLFSRVRAGAPESSYLMFKLDGPPQPCFIGDQMPAGGRAPLSPTARALIAAWILQGAAAD